MAEVWRPKTWRCGEQLSWWKFNRTGHIRLHMPTPFMVDVCIYNGLYSFDEFWMDLYGEVNEVVHLLLFYGPG